MSKFTSHCACPSCGGNGRSVAAMHYRETRQWHRSGSVSGSGVGLGTGGIGVGIGGGSYSETGEVSTKRAATFAEPTPNHLPVAGIFLFALLMACVLFKSVDVIGWLSDAGFAASPADSGPRLDNITPALFTLVKWVAPIAGALTLWHGWQNAMRNAKENERIDAVDTPAKLERYNQIRYCDECNLLFDAAGNDRSAHALGFSQMMDIPAIPKN